MAISVLFPDGVSRDVPAELRPVAGALGRVRFSKRPTKADPRWRYVEVNGRWHAVERRSDVATLVPPTREWWRVIVSMGDVSVDAVSRSNVA